MENFMFRKITSEKYIYRNLPIGGGGYVTGITFHPACPDRLYIRTDIGGTYRYDFETQHWICLCDSATALDLAETYPLAIAVDKNKRDSFFIACGDRDVSCLCISDDCGRSFVRRKIPARVHGNEPGRGTGERLHVRGDRVYFGSMHDGILISRDMGESWEKRTVCGEKNISLLWISEDEKIIIAGVSGEVNSPDGVTRGNTLYCSFDGCESFQAVFSPEPQVFEEADYYGYVPQRTAFDGKYLYVTFSASGRIHWGGWNSYSCDSGQCVDGRIFKYEIGKDGVRFVGDVTPADNSAPADRKICGGYSGISCRGKMLAASTICRRGGDIVWRSFDGGEHWEKILHGLDVGRMDWNISYMKPEYSGGTNCIHWLSDIKISPSDPDFALFNTGTGIFCTKNFTDKQVTFAPFCEGIEETVHLNVYAPPRGRTRVIDIVGDLGGFAFADIDKPCENSFADEKGNRYITCLNGDFTLKDPERIVATPRGNWTGLTKGGLILSCDGGQSWKRLPQPYGISEEIDKALEEIAKPNVDPGWAAVSADGGRISWAISRSFSSRMTVFTDDEGVTWKQSEFLDSNGRKIEDSLSVRIFTDLYDENCAFAVTEDFRIFLSFDKSESFKEADSGAKLKRVRFGKYQLTRQPDRPCTFWIAAANNGLYRFEFDRNGKISAKNILPDGDFALTVGFGKGRESLPAMYVTGVVGGEYGFYRSDPLGESWVRVNDSLHNFGEINAVCGDWREYGRFYLATGTKGLITGAPLK